MSTVFVLENVQRTYLLHNRQNPWLRVVVPIGSDAQVDLLVRGVGAVGGDQAKERTAFVSMTG